MTPMITRVMITRVTITRVTITRVRLRGISEGRGMRFRVGSKTVAGHHGRFFQNFGIAAEKANPALLTFMLTGG